MEQEKLKARIIQYQKIYKILNKKMYETNRKMYDQSLIVLRFIALKNNCAYMVKAGKDDVYSADFMADCYADGVQNAVLCSHFGTDDHHIYDQIQKVLVRIIRVVMSYDDKED